MTPPVSIPFREDLYSDKRCILDCRPKTNLVSIPFREDLYSDEISFITDPRGRVHTVSIPFREDLYSDTYKFNLSPTPTAERFHPFQGRPLFGPDPRQICTRVGSGSFHPFQGRPLFGQETKTLKIHPFEAPVSIPFREDLYSDD